MKRFLGGNFACSVMSTLKHFYLVIQCAFLCEIFVHKRSLSAFLTRYIYNNRSKTEDFWLFSGLLEIEVLV